MRKNISALISSLVFVAFIVGLAVTCFAKEPVDILQSERRRAEQFPEFSVEGVMDKTFFDSFEKYMPTNSPCVIPSAPLKRQFSLSFSGRRITTATTSQRVIFLSLTISSARTPLKKPHKSSIRFMMNTLQAKTQNATIRLCPIKTIF